MYHTLLLLLERSVAGSATGSFKDFIIVAPENCTDQMAEKNRIVSKSIERSLVLLTVQHVS